MSKVYAKEYSFHTLSGDIAKSESIKAKKLAKLGITDKIGEITDKTVLENEIISALAEGGLVCWIKRGKEMYGCAVFEKVKHNTSEFMGNKNFSSIKGIKENEECFILELRHIYNVPELEKFMPDIENDIKVYAEEYVNMSDIKAVLWNDELICRSDETNNYAMGMLIGIPLGLCFGWLIFDSPGIGLCFGVAWGPLFSFVFSNVKKNNKNSEEKDVV